MISVFPYCNCGDQTVISLPNPGWFVYVCLSFINGPSTLSRRSIQHQSPPNQLKIYNFCLHYLLKLKYSLRGFLDEQFYFIFFNIKGETLCVVFIALHLSSSWISIYPIGFDCLFTASLFLSLQSSSSICILFR
jgi:hypothetical protein